MVIGCCGDGSNLLEGKGSSFLCDESQHQGEFVVPEREVLRKLKR